MLSEITVAGRQLSRVPVFALMESIASDRYKALTSRQMCKTIVRTQRQQLQLVGASNEVDSAKEWRNMPQLTDRSCEDLPEVA